MDVKLRGADWKSRSRELGNHFLTKGYVEKCNREPDSRTSNVRLP